MDEENWAATLETCESLGTNDTVKLLAHDMTPELELILRMTYDKKYKFGVSIPTIEKAIRMKLKHFRNYGVMGKDLDLDFCYKQCQKLSGNALKDFLFDNAVNINNVQFYWFLKSISKNLNIGINIASVNEVFKQCDLVLIEDFQVQLCAPAYIMNDGVYVKKGSEIVKSDKLTEVELFAEVKYDGVRVVAEVTKEYVKLTSRQGFDKTEEFPEIVIKLMKWFSNTQLESVTLDGEVISDSFESVAKRLGRDSENITKDNNLKFVVFDITNINDECLKSRGFSDRRFIMNNNIENNEWVGKSHIVSVQKFSPLVNFYNECVDNGEEGVVIKDPNGTYAIESKDERKGAWKIKPFHEVDLRIVDFYEGEKKYTGSLGGITCIDDKGDIEVNVGSGFSDELRKHIWHNQYNYKNKIVEVKYQSLTKINNNTRKRLKHNISALHSLKFGTFNRFRPDKEDTN